MPLSDTALRALKPMERRYKKADQRGLYIEIEPNGSKLWRYKYRFEGLEKRIALGRYPDVSLSQARRKQEDARRLLEDGKDPSLERRRERLVASINAENTFGGIAREYIQHKMIGEQRAEVTIAKARWLLEQLDPLAKMPVAEIRPAEVLGALRRIEAKGNLFLVQKGSDSSQGVDLGVIYGYSVYYDVLSDPTKTGYFEFFGLPSISFSDDDVFVQGGERRLNVSLRIEQPAAPMSAAPLTPDSSPNEASSATPAPTDLATQTSDSLRGPLRSVASGLEQWANSETGTSVPSLAFEGSAAQKLAMIRQDMASFHSPDGIDGGSRHVMMDAPILWYA